ncbi:MAG: RNA ligase family protein [Planctomycetes bacterium]|nr:RNA ligase family protein [Planctomycetota bacterium]
MNDGLVKYPRTPHLEGSRLQPGDEDLDQVPLRDLAHHTVFIEEKLDGANAGLSFTRTGELCLQSRGHFLTGGYRERHFQWLKTWASTFQADLWERLGDRYVVYGEWLFAKHTIFYDALPHYFLEFDVYDRADQLFLSASRRRRLLEGTRIVSVPVLWEGRAPDRATIDALLGPSHFKTAAWKERLLVEGERSGVPPERLWRESDASSAMEGLYLKAEDEHRVLGRYKFVRASFLTTVVDSGSHWLDRPIVRNALRAGFDPFAFDGEELT